MADYTKVNLKQVDDSAPAFGHEGNHEARFATKNLGLEKSGLSYQKIHPNKQIPFNHHHNEQEEVYIVISGSGAMRFGDETIELGPYDAVRVHADTDRVMMAGDEGIEYVVYGAPKTEQQDAVIV